MNSLRSASLSGTSGGIRAADMPPAGEFPAPSMRFPKRCHTIGLSRALPGMTYRCDGLPACPISVPVSDGQRSNLYAPEKEMAPDLSDSSDPGFSNDDRSNRGCSRVWHCTQRPLINGAMSCLKSTVRRFSGGSVNWNGGFLRASVRRLGGVSSRSSWQPMQPRFSLGIPHIQLWCVATAMPFSSRSWREIGVSAGALK